MLGYLKRHLAVLIAGTVMLSGATYVAAQVSVAPVPSNEVTLAQADAPDEGTAPDEEAPAARKGMRPFHRPPVRGELVVPGQEDGTFNTIKIDRGILKSVNGTTVVIDEADGTTVEIPTDENTRVHRDREEAKVGDLVAGDHIFALRVKDGDTFVTKGIRAISAEKWEEFQSRREDRREDRRDFRRERRQERRNAGDVPQA